MENHPKRLVTTLAKAMEAAEMVAGSTGPEKRNYVVAAVRSLAASSLSYDEAIVVGEMAPHLVDLVISATKGRVLVNIRSPDCCALQ